MQYLEMKKLIQPLAGVIHMMFCFVFLIQLYQTTPNNYRRMLSTIFSLLFGEEISVSFIVNRLSNALKHTLFALPKEYGGYEGATEEVEIVS